MSLWAIAALGAAAAHFWVVTRSRGFFTGDGIFVASQLLMVLGTLTIVNRADAVEEKYLTIVFAPFFVYCFFSILLHVANPVNAVRIKVVTSPFKGPEVLLALVSAAIVVAYFQAVGYSTFLVGARSLISGEEADLATLRVDSYSGSRYLAPGYVNQFKNAILPALAVVGSVALFKSKSPAALPWSLTLVGGSILGLLGTGQRGAFILASLVMISLLRYATPPRRFVRRLLPVGLLLLSIVMGSTLVLGRSGDEVARQESVSAKSNVLLEELWGRVTADNQKSGVAAFRYTESIPPGWGQDWWEGMLGLTPFHRGSDLSGKVFATIYGSERGTSPPSIWGSVYYNFGFMGLVIIPLLLVLINRAVARKFFASPERDALEVLGYCGVFVLMGMWVAGGPEYLFNNGLGAYVLLIYVGSRRRKRVIDAALQPATFKHSGR